MPLAFKKKHPFTILNMVFESEISSGKFHVSYLPFARIGKYIRVVPAIFIPMLMS